MKLKKCILTEMIEHLDSISAKAIELEKKYFKEFDNSIL
jgi:hypothetical protein